MSIRRRSAPITPAATTAPSFPCLTTATSAEGRSGSAGVLEYVLDKVVYICVGTTAAVLDEVVYICVGTTAAVLDEVVYICVGTTAAVLDIRSAMTEYLRSIHVL